MYRTDDMLGSESASSGTADFTLSGAAGNDFLAIENELSDGDVAIFTAVDGADREVFIGTFVAATPKVTRTTVLRSTNSGSLVNFGSAPKVYLTPSATMHRAPRELYRPRLADFTWNNQGSATAADVDRGVQFVGDAIGNSNNWHMLQKAYPTVPFTLIIKFKHTAPGKRYHQVALGVRDSGTGRFNNMHLERNTGHTVQRWTNETTHNSTTTDYGALITMPEWIKLVDNNTNLIFSYSHDGEFWIDFPATARTGWCASLTHVFFGWQSNNLATPNLQSGGVIESWYVG